LFATQFENVVRRRSGAFLVRPSSMPNCKALTHVVQDGKVGHALIVSHFIAKNSFRCANAAAYDRYRRSPTFVLSLVAVLYAIYTPSNHYSIRFFIEIDIKYYHFR
jgi:hypothetical protein